MVSPDSQGTACPSSGRNSTYRSVQISGAGSEYTFAEKEKRCAAMIPNSDFFTRRAIDRKTPVKQFVYSPQSAHTRKMVRIAYDGAVRNRDVSWMWNPRYYKNYFQTKITYESYPESQSEVDDIATKFHLSNIIYDP
jgi:hypothetical protein